MSSYSTLALVLNTDLLSRCSLTQCFAQWQQELQHDVDKDFLLNGIASGFPLVSDISTVQAADCRNYKSALHPNTKPLLEELFLQELNLGRISESCVKPLRVNSIGSVAKTGSATPRPITDCSKPSLNSVNSYSDPEQFHFQTINDVVRLTGPNWYFSVVDIKSAYRHVPIRPKHRPLQGFRWKFPDQQEKFYIDNFLCFGLAVAPRIFNKISSAISRMISRRGFSIVSYLDDFLVAAPTFAECEFAKQTLIILLISLGFEVKWEKVQEPSTRVKFLGLIIDFVHRRLELPLDKLAKLTETATQLSLRNKITKKELQHFLGFASFASRAVYGARTFSRLIIDVMSSLTESSHRTRVTRVLRQEFSWWAEFSGAFNGLVPCPLGLRQRTAKITTDASLSGFAATMSLKWLAGSWDDIVLPPFFPESMAACWLPAPLIDDNIRENINFLELVAAAVAILSWAPELAGTAVVIESDNSATISYLNRGTSRNSCVLMWLRLIFYASLEFDFRVSAKHCPGILNIAADALSRLTTAPVHLERFRNAFYMPAVSQLTPFAHSRYPTRASGETVAGFAQARYGRFLSKNPANSVE